MQILIVEDIAVMGRMIRRSLEQLGHAAEVAPDLLTARQLLAEREFDLLLTDYDLPDGNGRDFAAEVKASRPGCPVILVTGSSAVQEAGPADLLLLKPFTRAGLIEALAACTGT